MIRLMPILWLIFLAGVIYNIWQAPITQESKWLWTGVVFFFPGVGVVMWLLYGRTRF